MTAPCQAFIPVGGTAVDAATVASVVQHGYVTLIVEPAQKSEEDGVGFRGTHDDNVDAFAVAVENGTPLLAGAANGTVCLVHVADEEGAMTKTAATTDGTKTTTTTTTTSAPTTPTTTTSTTVVPKRKGFWVLLRRTEKETTMAALKEQLRRKDEQLRRKDEQLRLKDEQLDKAGIEMRRKDEQIEENDKELVAWYVMADEYLYAKDGPRRSEPF